MATSPRSAPECLDGHAQPLSTNSTLLDGETHLPLPVAKIPQHVQNLAECAAYEIERLSQQDSWTDLEEDAMDDGFFLCDLRTVQAKLRIWRRLFPAVKPFFALKCHPDPMVAAVLGQSGLAGFDCASLSEIRLALASTQNNTRQIIYANPQRAEDALQEALQLGVRVLTFDGAEELRKVHRIYQEQIVPNSNDPIIPPQMVLRILVPDEHSTIPLGEKFGAPPNQWNDLIQLAVDLRLPVVGVSFHCGSGNHDPASYVQAIELAKQALETIQRVQPNITPWLLDIGGGYPGFDGCGGDKDRFTHRQNVDATAFCRNGNESEPSHNDSTAQVGQAVSPLLKDLFANYNHDIQFVAEPGRYFVEAAFALCSRIFKVKRVQGENGQTHYHYYIAHGVQGVFKDILLCGEVFTPQALPLASSDDSVSSQVFPSMVHGPSGHDFDLVCPHVELPKLVTGDWLLFDRMGAYTLSIASRSGQPPVRYVW